MPALTEELALAMIRDTEAKLKIIADNFKAQAAKMANLKMELEAANLQLQAGQVKNIPDSVFVALAELNDHTDAIVAGLAALESAPMAGKAPVETGQPESEVVAEEAASTGQEPVEVAPVAEFEGQPANPLNFGNAAFTPESVMTTETPADESSDTSAQSVSA